MGTQALLHRMASAMDDPLPATIFSKKLSSLSSSPSASIHRTRSGVSSDAHVGGQADASRTLDAQELLDVEMMFNSDVKSCRRVRHKRIRADADTRSGSVQMRTQDSTKPCRPCKLDRRAMTRSPAVTENEMPRYTAMPVLPYLRKFALKPVNHDVAWGGAAAEVAADDDVFGSAIPACYYLSTKLFAGPHAQARLNKARAV